MNRSYIKALSAVLALVLAFCVSACTDDDTDRAVQGNASGGVIRFSLTDISKNDGTRAGEETQTNREKAVSTVYVVAFNHSTGKFATSTLAADISENTTVEGDWRADLGSPDVYDVYFIANASADLQTAISGLTRGTSEKSDFFAIVATQDPGTSTSEAFLMTSGEVAVTIDSDPQGTLIASEIDVIRASARIDIVVDAESIEEITSVQIQNRYTNTKVARTGADVSMDGLAKGSQTYTIASGAENKKVLREAIYAYEDPSKSTVIVISAKLTDGTVVTPTVSFSDAEVALQRNRLYTVTLSAGSAGSKGSIASTINVADWTSGATVSKTATQLADRTAPTFEIAASGEGWTYVGATSTVSISAATATSFTVTVTSAGSSFSKLVCKNQVEGFTVTETASSTASGHPVQTFTVAISENTGDAARTFEFSVENLLDADATGTSTSTFTVEQPAPQP